jgi:hypothetical protein
MPLPPSPRSAWARRPWLAEPATALYIGLIALIAQTSGVFYVLFPELGALSHDVLKRPHGVWARAPLMLLVTPLLTAIAGTLIVRHLPYGFPAVLLDVGASVLVIAVLRSPIAPAISAGLMPLALDIRSRWYPPSILIGTGLLAGLSLLWRRIGFPVPVGGARHPDDDVVEQPPSDYSWVPFFVLFLLLACAASERTGLRLVLFPPLVVIGFEMFSHPSHCPWADRPLALLAACGSTAAVGVLCVTELGAGPIGAMVSILAGVGILRLLDLHVPPALAVALLPFILTRPGWTFPVAVLAGTLLQVVTFATWRMLVRLRRERTA